MYHKIPQFIKLNLQKQRIYRELISTNAGFKWLKIMQQQGEQSTWSREMRKKKVEMGGRKMNEDDEEVQKEERGTKYLSQKE